MSMVGPATEKTVTLWQMAEDFDAFPDFREEDYVAAEVQAGRETPSTQASASARPLYPYPPFVLPGKLSGQKPYAVPEYVMPVETNIPDGTVALAAGATALGSDGEAAGDVERIFVDAETEEATHLLIVSGFLMKERKLVPVSWIRRINEESVELSVESAVVRSLPDYEEGEDQETEEKEMNNGTGDM
jgi:hypothetical protein